MKPKTFGSVFTVCWFPCCSRVLSSLWSGTSSAHYCQGSTEPQRWPVWFISHVLIFPYAFRFFKDSGFFFTMLSLSVCFCFVWFLSIMSEAFILLAFNLPVQNDACCTVWSIFTLKHIASWDQYSFGVKRIQDFMKRLDLKSHLSNQIVFHSGVMAMLFGHGKYGAHFRVTHSGSNNRGTNY